MSWLMSSTKTKTDNTEDAVLIGLETRSKRKPYCGVASEHRARVKMYPFSDDASDLCPPWATSGQQRPLTPYSCAALTPLGHRTPP